VSAADGAGVPVQGPTPLFAVDVPAAWYETYQRPVAGGDLVLLAAGWGQGFDAGTGPALVALDATSGTHRWTLEVPVLRDRATECEVGEPVLLPDGHFLVPVYQWDAALTVYIVDRRGRVVRRDDLAAGREVTLEVFAADAGIKLWLEPSAAGSGAYLVSWTYRSSGYHAQCRDAATGALRWEAGDRVLAVRDGIVVTEPTASGRGRPPTGYAVAGRTIVDGTERWRLPESARGRVRPWSVAGGFEGSVVLADRRRVALAAGEDLVGIGWTDGSERWRCPLPGRVVSTGCGPDAVYAVVVDAAGDAWLERIGPDGARRGVATALGTATPVVVAADAEHVLLADAGELTCVPVGEPDRVAWRLPLPADPRIDRALPTDRDIRAAAITLDRGRLYLRAGTRLYGFG
jgi:outer membrane protein assembly factor BamB